MTHTLHNFVPSFTLYSNVKNVPNPARQHFEKTSTGLLSYPYERKSAAIYAAGGLRHITLTLKCEVLVHHRCFINFFNLSALMHGFSVT